MGEVGCRDHVESVGLSAEYHGSSPADVSRQRLHEVRGSEDGEGHAAAGDCLLGVELGA